MSSAVETGEIIGVLQNPGAYRQVTYRLSERDWQRAAWLHPSSKVRKRVIVLLALFFLVAGVLVWVLGYPTFAIVAFVIAVVYPVLLYWQVRESVRKSYWSLQAVVARPVTMTYGKGFVAFHATTQFSFSKWLYSAIIDKDYRLLGTSNLVYVIVPVSAFENPAKLAEFDSIIEELAEKVIGR